MKKYFTIKVSFFALILCGSLFSCVDDDQKDDKVKNVDQVEFLSNSAIIISENYAALAQSSKALAAAAEITKQKANNNSLNDQQLDSLKDKLKTAWKDWQKISLFSFGASEQLALRSNVNIFKTDTQTIESSIQTGNYNLDQLSFKSAKGFPAIDYLLNAKSAAFTINNFNTDSNCCKYLCALTNDIAKRVEAVKQTWENEKENFKANTGTDIGSSTGMIVNALNLHYEKFFRNNKLGIPLGVRSSGIAKPDFCEAVYGGYSVELAKDNFEAFKNFYFGISANNINGYGLDNYLIDANAEEVNNKIESRINEIDLKLNALSDPLPQQIATDPTTVQETYTAIQQLIVLLKVDLPSRIGVLITYQDNDGD